MYVKAQKGVIWIINSLVAKFSIVIISYFPQRRCALQKTTIFHFKIKSLETSHFTVV